MQRLPEILSDEPMAIPPCIDVHVHVVRSSDDDRLMGDRTHRKWGQEHVAAELSDPRTAIGVVWAGSEGKSSSTKSAKFLKKDRNHLVKKFILSTSSHDIGSLFFESAPLWYSHSLQLPATPNPYPERLTRVSTPRLCFVEFSDVQTFFLFLSRPCYPLLKRR
jgi:hypothetical protein